MNTVIEMAIEVGISDLTIDLYQQELERFAELVRADEREACAKVCMGVSSDITRFGTAAECVNAIRARSNNDK